MFWSEEVSKNQVREVYEFEALAFLPFIGGIIES